MVLKYDIFQRNKSTTKYSAPILSQNELHILQLISPKKKEIRKKRFARDKSLNY